MRSSSWRRERGALVRTAFPYAPRDFRGRRPKIPFPANDRQRPGLAVENSELRDFLRSDVHAGEARRGDDLLERCLGENAHFQSGSIAAVERKILEHLERAVAAAIHQHGAPAGRGQRVFVQLGKMFGRAPVESIRHGQQQQAVRLQHPVQIHEGPLHGRRNVFQNLARQDEIVPAGVFRRCSGDGSAISRRGS